MIEVEGFELDGVFRKLEEIERQMQEFRAEIPLEFDRWQTEDMNRKNVSTQVFATIGRSGWNFGRASTTVLPTSRYRVKKRRGLVRKRLKAGMVAQRPMVSRRPILRAELIERFHVRFRNLLDRAF